MGFNNMNIDDKIMIIEEQTGQKRKIVLRGPSMPFRGAGWETEQKIIPTWYAGNPAASVQILGKQEHESIFEGSWNDYLLGDGKTIELVKLFDDICNSGQLLKVTWGHITRYGYLIVFSHKYDTCHDVKWSMTFFWQQREKKFVYQTQFKNYNFDQRVLDLDKLAKQIDLLLGQSPLGLKKYIESIDRNITQLQSKIQEYGNIIQQGIDELTMPIHVANHALATIGTIREQCFEISTSIHATSASAKSVNKNIEEIFNADTWCRAFSLNLDEINYESAKQEQNLKTIINGLNIGFIRTSEQDDLRRISIRTYERQNNWKKIADKNKLMGSKPVSGKMIYLPSD